MEYPTPLPRFWVCMFDTFWILSSDFVKKTAGTEFVPSSYQFAHDRAERKVRLEQLIYIKGIQRVSLSGIKYVNKAIQAQVCRLTKFVPTHVNAKWQLIE